MDTIIRTLVEDILVFAYSTEDQIAEDFSVSQLERIAQALSAAGGQVIQQFQDVVQIMASEARSVGQTERAVQLESMPSHLGIT